MKSLKAKAHELKKEITALYYAYRDPDTGILPKLILLFTLGYALSPIDLIPDFIPVIGYLDDLIIIPALIKLSIRLIPEEVMRRSREKAQAEPLNIGKNWMFGILFILIWTILIIYVVIFTVDLMRK